MWNCVMIRVLVFIITIKCCESVIYDITDATYDQMPPLFGLEDYHSCLRLLNGTYCLARFELYAKPANELIQLVHEYSAFHLKHYNHTYIQRGICLTRSCKKYLNRNWSQERALEACLNDTITAEYGIHSKLVAIYYCETDADMPVVDNYDWGLLGAVAAVLIINIVASLRKITLYNKRLGKDGKENCSSFLDHFAIQTNWEKLTSPQSSIGNLRILHGIRCIAMFFIIFGHSMWLIEFGFVDNPHDFEKGYDTPLFMLIFNGMMLVQVFFVLSGFLFAYNVLQHAEVEELAWRSVPRVVLYRWFRLSPALIATVWASATWLRLLGSGPLWGLYMARSAVADCRRYWWLHLLYLNNNVPEDRFCALHTWYIAADFQLHVSALVAVVWWRHGSGTVRRAKVAVLAIMAVTAGFLAPALHVWRSQLFPLPILKPEFHRTFVDEHYHSLHVAAHTNLPGFLLGAAAAYKFYQWKNNQQLPSKFPRGTLVLSLLAALAIQYSGAVWYEGGNNAVEGAAETVVRLLYAGLHRGAFAGAVAIALLALLTGGDGGCGRALRGAGWAAPARLSYCAFLLHAPLLQLLVAGRTQLAHVSMLYVVVNHLGVVSLSLLLSLPLHLLLEAPATSLLRAALQSTAPASAPHTSKKLP